MSLWTLDEIAAALGVAPPAQNADVTGLSIDSRTLKKGELFIALKAARDGHEFIPTAAKKGAVAALVDHRVDVDIPLLKVENVLHGLGQIGIAARRRSKARRVAVTGSCGKSTVKEMLAVALPGAHKPEQSFNNHWGVPLTLARMPKNADFGVFEIGMNHPGEIAPLSKLVRPHIAAVINVAPAHIGAFKNILGVAEEKLSIADGLQKGGILCLPEAKDLPDGHEKFIPHNIELHTFGHGPAADCRIVRFDPATQRLKLNILGEDYDVGVCSGAEHMHLNTALVLLMVKLLGENVEEAAHRLLGFENMAGRGRVQVAGGVQVVDESFNANPLSVKAALETFRTMKVEGRRVAILGDMLELGTRSKSYHEGLAPELRGMDEVILCGPQMRHLYQQVKENSNVRWVEKSKEIDPKELAKALQKGDGVLVKGSKMMFWVHDFVPKLCHTLNS